MKRHFAWLLSLCLLLSLAACAGESAAPRDTGKQTAPATAAPATEPGADPTETTESVQPIKTEDPVTPAELDLRELFDRNLTCMLSIFDLGYLYYEDNGDPAPDGLYRVSDPRFPDYAALDAFVRETYVKKKADELLLGELLPGHVLYRNVNGVIYIDSAVIGGKGYYVDWSRYTVTVTEQTADRCAFTVSATVAYPSEKPVSEPYERACVAVLENGVWLLQDAVI